MCDSVHSCLATRHTLQICTYSLVNVAVDEYQKRSESTLKIGDIHSEKLCFLPVGTICSADISVCDS